MGSSYLLHAFHHDRSMFQGMSSTYQLEHMSSATLWLYPPPPFRRRLAEGRAYLVIQAHSKCQIGVEPETLETNLSGDRSLKRYRSWGISSLLVLHEKGFSSCYAKGLVKPRPTQITALVLRAFGDILSFVRAIYG